MTTTTTTTPSGAADPFAAVTTLGGWLSTHETRVQSARGRGKIAQFTLVFGVAMLVFGGFLVMQDSDNALCLILPAVGLLLLGALGVWDAKSARDLRVALFEEGIAASEKKGLSTMRWSEVARAFEILTRRGNTNIIQHGYRLENASGQKIWWNDDVSGAAQAWETVRQRLYPRLVNEASAALARGESVTFGELTVSRAGLAQGKKSLPWAEIREVTVQNGTLAVRGTRGGKPEELRALWATLPNGSVLLNLIEQMRS